MKNLLSISCIVAICLVLFLIPLNSGQALFFDFEDEAQLEEWTIISGAWQIDQDDVNNSNVASGEGADDLILAIGDDSWTDYTVEFEANGLTDDVGIVFRLQDINNYTAFLIAPNLNLSEWFVKQGGAFDENVGNKGDGLGVSTNEWHKYKLVVEGMQASIFVDDEEAFDPLDIGDGFESGGIGLRQWGDHGHYDNVLISGPGIPLSAGESVEPDGKLASIWGSIKVQ
ncbi:family 16 glycoside hydrolase [Candidatus Poribacteria bacterium]